jgi:hypothetical protein
VFSEVGGLYCDGVGDRSLNTGDGALTELVGRTIEARLPDSHALYIKEVEIGLGVVIPSLHLLCSTIRLCRKRQLASNWFLCMAIEQR